METGNFKLNYLKCFDLKRPLAGQNIHEQTGIRSRATCSFNENYLQRHFSLVALVVT